MTSRRRATLSGIAAILLWASLAVLTTTASLPPFQLLALTFLLGGIFGCIWLVRPGGPGLAALRQAATPAALTTTALFTYHALYFIAFRRAPAVEVNLVNYLWPLLIVVFTGWFAGIRVYPGQWLGTFLGLAGAALAVTRGQSLDIQASHITGYLAALGAALTWSAYSVLNRRFGTVPSAAIAGPCLMVGVLAALVHVTIEPWIAPTMAQWAATVAMAIGPVGAAFWLWDKGTKHGDLVLLGTLSYAAPLLSTGLLLLAGRARPHWAQAGALALLSLGAFMSIHSAHRHENFSPSQQ
jgi:drug/metabolite transporter (DMT)-like permease